MKTTWLAGILLAAAAVTAVASEWVTQKPKTEEGRVVVTFWAGWTNFEADAMREVIKKFNNQQDRITVRFLSVSGISEKTLLSIASGTPPDLALLGSSILPQYAFENALTPLDEWAAEAGIEKEDYLPVYWELLNYNDRLWAMAATPATTALHYNRAMWEEVGQTEAPKTIEELDALDAKLVKRSGNRVTRAGFLPAEPGWWPWSWAPYFGGQLLSEDGEITMMDPNNIRAFEWMQGYTKRYGVSAVQAFREGFGGFDSPQNAFLDGKVSSVLQGVWMANFIEKHRPEMKWDVVPFPHPANRPDLANSAVAELDVMVIPRGAKNAKEAWEFLVFLQSQEAMELLCLGQRKHSPLASVSDRFWAEHQNPRVRLFWELASSENAFSTPWTPIWPAWSAELSAAIQDINLGKASVKEALQRVQSRVEPLQREVLELEAKRRSQEARP